jgi:hypothetical protein
MQRRNFRLAAKNQQRLQIGGSAPRGDQKRVFNFRGKDHRPGGQATEQSPSREPGPRPDPDDEARWQDDGGESGEK